MANEAFENTTDDNQYPMTDWSTSSLTAKGSRPIIVDFFQTWKQRKNGKSIRVKQIQIMKLMFPLQCNNRPGVYMAAGNQAADGSIRIVLAQDAGGTTDEAKRMTFRTLEGFAGEGVTFESVYYPGYYVVSRDGALYLDGNPGTRKRQHSLYLQTPV